MTETYCTLCQAPFSSGQAAKEHFAGKRHLKNLEKLRMMPPSTEAWSATTRGASQPKTTQSQQQSVTQQNSSYCDLCNAPFSSIEAARQHYAGKRHIKMVVKQQIFPAIASNVAGMVRKTTTTTQSASQVGDSSQEKQRPTTSGRDTMAAASTSLLSVNVTSSSKPNTKTDPQYKRLNTRDLKQEKQRPTTSGSDSIAATGTSLLSANDTSSSKPNTETDHLKHAEKTDQPTNDQQSPSAHGVSTHTVRVRHGARSPWVRTVDSSSSALSQSFSEEDAYFCKTCSMPLSGPVPAKQHYSGRTHRKRSQTARCSSQLLGILEKGGQSNSRPDLDLESSRREVEKTTFCGVCYVPLSGPQPAMQHYSGRAHKRKLELLKKGELPMIPLPWQRHPTGVASSKEEDSGVSMSDGLQEETNKQQEESKETKMARNTLKSSTTTEEKCSPFSKSSDIGMDQSERRSASGGQIDQSARRSAPGCAMDQSERRSAFKGQMDQSERRSTSGGLMDQSKQRSASISGGHMDQSEWRSASQDQSSSSMLRSSSWSSPFKFGHTRAPSEIPFARPDCRLYSRSVSAPTSGHRSTSRLACNFQTQMAPPNTGERTAQPGTLRAGFPPKSSSSTVCEEKGTQSVAVLPFVSRQLSIPVVIEDKPCKKTFLKTSPTLSSKEDLNAFKTTCPSTSDMLPRAAINLKDDTTIDNQQRPQKGNEIVSGTEADDFRSSVGQAADASTSEQIAKNCQEMKDARGKIEDFLRNRPDQGAPKEPPSTSPSERSSTITTEREKPPTHGPAQAITNTTSPEEPLFFCDVCKLSMSGPRPLFDHYNGAKHKKKLKILALLNPENTTGPSNSFDVQSNGPLAMACGNLPTTPGDNMNSTANKTHNKDLDIKYTSTSMFSSTAFMKKISEQIARTPQEKEELLSDVTVIPCSQPVHFK